MSTEDTPHIKHSNDTDPLALKDILGREKRCQIILDKRPDDDGARIELAWCLLMQAIHREGQESVINKVAPLINTPLTKLFGDAQQLTQRESRWLFAESLKHSFAVSKLSSNPKCLQEAERLKELIKISAGEEVIMDVEDISAKVMSQLSKEISRRPAYYRYCSHRPLRRHPKR